MQRFNLLSLLRLLALAAAVAAPPWIPKASEAQCGRSCRRPAPRQFYAAPAYRPTYRTAPTPVQGGSLLVQVNALRARHGLNAVGYDAGLAGLASANNGIQVSRGLGHHVAGGYQNAASTGDPGYAMRLWQSSPAHLSNLLQPGVRTVGYAFGYSYSTLILR